MIPFLLISTLISLLIISISVWEDNRLIKLRHDINVLSEKIRAIEKQIKIEIENELI